MSQQEDSLLDQTYTVVVLKSTGLRFINGISSSYSDDYDPVLVGVISESELTDVVRRLNEVIQSFWPCNTCYAFGYICSPFTLGTSLLVPSYCISHSEKHAKAMLENVTLRAKYYDRNIQFKLVKSFCDSHVEIRFPSSLVERGSIGSTQMTSDDNYVGANDVHSIISCQPTIRAKSGEVTQSKDTVSQPPVVYTVPSNESTTTSNWRMKNS